MSSYVTIIVIVLRIGVVRESSRLGHLRDISWMVFCQEKYEAVRESWITSLVTGLGYRNVSAVVCLYGSQDLQRVKVL